MKTSNPIFILSFISGILICGCSASTGSRYEAKESESEKITGDTDIVEDFDFTSRKIEFNLPEVRIPSNFESTDAWYGYEDRDNIRDRKVTGTTNGYRVQVLITDNLEEAENMRNEILFSTNMKEVYITFDPPFYKVKVGDFITKTDAENFSFKLTQLGYSDLRIVNELVNIYE
ncbi:MAG: hypothetical protein Kow0098_20410 [Ignavibacteriaceae bacterium]